MNNRFKLFIDNFLVYGLGGLISKLIPFIMLPIITRLFPNAFYIGLNDLSVTLTSFMSSLAICGMYDAMFRLFFDKDDLNHQKEICSTAFFFVLSVSVVLSVGFMFAREAISGWYFESKEYTNLVVLTVISFLISTTNQIVSAPTRIQNKKRIFLITNTISPCISYAISIPLILNGYYVVAMPLASIVAALTIEISFMVMNHKWFALKYFRIGRLKELLQIGLPLMPNFVVYWIYNSVDKLMISKMMGTEYTGIYAVASKIGHISNLIYTAFAGGWLYFAYNTMNDEDQVQLKSRVFEYLGAVSFVATIMLMAVARPGFRILFGEEYLSGYLIAPYLFLSPLLLMLFQTAANQFTIIKKTYMNTVTLFVGAVMNIILNYVLIPVMGMEGASLATVAGYICSLSLCVFILNKKKLIVVPARFYISILIMLVYFLTWRVFYSNRFILSTLFAVVSLGLYILLYRKDIKSIMKNRKGG